MNNIIRFNRTERSIIISLLFIFLCLVSYRYYIVYIHDYTSLRQTTDHKTNIHTALQQRKENTIEKYKTTQLNQTKTREKEASKPAKKTHKKPTTKENKKRQKQVNNLFAFDPNTVDSSSLVRLGFRSYIIKNMLKYRAAGGHFKQKSDLKKVYGMTDNFYVKLQDYIKIKPKVALPSAYPKTNKSDFTAEKIDINTCSFGQLMRLDSMETKIAGRILKYRDKLGGFHTINQLTEVYQLSDKQLEKWRNNLSISTVELPKTSINFATEEELANLPYLSRKKARVIKNYINQHGKLQQKDDLKPIKILDEDLINKLHPYLSYDDSFLVPKATKLD